MQAPPPYLAQYLQFVGFFFFSLSSRPLLVRLRALHDVVLFRLGGGVCVCVVIVTGIGRGISDSFYFCFRRPLLGAGPLLSEVVAAWALSLSLSN